MEQENVYGRRFMDLCYQSPPGRRITNLLLSRKPVSRLYGWLQKRPWSRRQIPGFVKQYCIDLSEAVVPQGGFACFNDFFIRRLKPEARPVDRDPCRLVSPADSRLQIFALSRDVRLNVKGNRWSLARLLGTTALDDRYRGGLCFCFRLAPCDYHRFGYADHGIQGPVHTLPGPLHSVNPLALQHKQDILATNYRQWCFVQSPCFGTMIQVEVGALIVGSIVQNQPHGGPCRRGGEKGYFQFGGSTVLLILEPHRASVDADILEKSSQGIETLVRYGAAVATAAQPLTTGP